MGNIKYITQYQSHDAWHDFGTPNADEPFAREVYGALKLQPVHPVRFVARLYPSQNAGLQGQSRCAFGFGTNHHCIDDGIVDAPNPVGRWGYWCPEHLPEVLALLVPDAYKSCTNMGEKPFNLVLETHQASR